MRKTLSLINKGWRPYVAAFLLGGLGGTAFAPYYLWPLLALSLTLFLRLLESPALATRGQAFSAVWLWGLGYFGVNLYWISFALGVDLGKFAWLIPFSLFGIPCLASAVQALPFLCLAAQATTPFRRWVIFSFAWATGEWIRGEWVFGGFPWNLTAYIWGDTPGMMQSVSLWGPYMLGLVTFLGLSSPALLFATQTSLKKRLLWFAVAANCLFLLGFWGSLRIQFVPNVPKLNLLLVQPNVAQEDKLNPALYTQQVQEINALTKASGTKAITHIIWPEAPLPFLLEGNTLHTIPLALAPHQHLVTGFLRRYRGKTYNSLIVVNAHKHVLKGYNKVHLVPFGEYIPGRAFLSRYCNMDWLNNFTLGSCDFTPGKGQKTLSVPGLPPFSPLICFDSAFSRGITSRDKRPTWILNLTNDAWFDNSPGLFQHFDQAKFRAIEEGLPVVQVGNTGITGVIDPYGTTKQRFPILTKTALTAQLPQAIRTPLYARYGNIIFWAALLMFLGGLLGYGKTIPHRFSRSLSQRRKATPKPRKTSRPSRKR